MVATRGLASSRVMGRRLHTFRCLMLARLKQGVTEWQGRHAIELGLDSCEGVKCHALLPIDSTAGSCLRAISGANVLASIPE